MVVATLTSALPADAIGAEYQVDESFDARNNSLTEITARDQNRVSSHQGTVGVSARKTTEPKCNQFGECEIQIQYSECLAEMDDRGITPTTAPPAPGTPIDTYTTVCFNALPEQRTRQRNPQDEADVTAWMKDYFRRTALPVPAPEMSAPNGGICGVVHTANLHMPVEMVHEETQTPFGPMRLHLYGTVYADWGDGKKDTYKSGGGPHPNSVIAHSWTDRGTYNITFRTEWEAKYSLGPYNDYTYTGTLSGLSTQASVPNFRVWEAQAMLVS